MGPTLPPGQLGRPGVSPGGGILVQQESIRFQQGPLPPPDILAQYERVHPGLSERIVAMAETQSRHRQELEGLSARTVSDDVTAFRAERKRGQIIGAIVVMVAVCAAAAVGIGGQGAWANAACAAIGGIPLAGLVLVFMTGKKDGNGQPSAKPTAGGNPDA